MNYFNVYSHNYVVLPARTKPVIINHPCWPAHLTTAYFNDGCLLNQRFEKHTFVILSKQFNNNKILACALPE